MERIGEKEPPPWPPLRSGTSCHDAVLFSDGLKVKLDDTKQYTGQWFEHFDQYEKPVLLKKTERKMRMPKQNCVRTIHGRMASSIQSGNSEK